MAQTGILDLIAQAGWVVKFVLLILFFGSVFCWAIIFGKVRTIRRALSEDDQFLKIFWNSKRLDEIFAKSEKFDRSPTALVFRSGFKELQKLSATDRSPAGAIEVENIERALNRALHAQIASVEHHVGWLATTAAAAPFVGLFGTVWGIMTSFRSIGATGAANLAVVAPGISEALIATALGLAAAIPAVVAYNHFVNQIKRLAIDMECFIQDFLNIIQRGLLAGKKTP